MRTYADASRCPDCGAGLPEPPDHCALCGLVLTGPAAVELFTTFQHADRLLGQLRVESAAAATMAGLTGPPPSADPAVAAEPLPSAALRGASVPRILLTLGALCLLVGAVTFLAVAWSFLGVGGRTAVLVGFTATAAGLSYWMWRRDLRTAAEALSVVTAGLLALDLVGASDAGWLDVSSAGLVMTVGFALGAAGLATTYAARDRRPLWAPQVIGAMGLLVAPAGALDLTAHDSAVLALSTLGLALVAGAARIGRVGQMHWFVAAVAGVWWLALAMTGLVRLFDHPRASELWSGLHPWPVLTAAAFLAVGAYAARRLTLPASLTAGVAAGLATTPLVSPVLDNSPTQAASALLVVTAAAALAALALARPWRAAAVLPMLGAVVVPVVVTVAIAGSIVESLLGVHPWTREISTRVSEVSTPAHPLLLPLTTVVVLLAAAAVAGFRPVVRGVVWAGWPVAATAVALSVVLAVAAYPIPLGALVIALLVLGLAQGAWSLLGSGHSELAGRGVAFAALGAALVVGLPSVVLTLVTLLVLLAAAVLIALRAPLATAREAALVALPLLLAGLVWTVSELADLDVSWRATPVLIVVGLLALLLPRPTVELPALAAGLVAALVSVPAAFLDSDSHGLVVLALDLTVAGAVVTASSLAHPHRRLLSIPGGLLLAMATWVRLYDLGVTAPEAYTLPSALVLLALGLRWLSRTPHAATVKALGPGLVLALVPTLLRALVDDAVSLRPLLLGLACLALVLGGTWLRWTAPLVVGAVVGAVLVLRELGPYAADLPPWLLIAAAGALLTVVGVTWESRMRDLRRAGDYLGHLR